MAGPGSSTARGCATPVGRPGFKKRCGVLRWGAKVILEGTYECAPTPTPGNLYRYQNEGVAEGAVCICMKANEIAKGKRGKAAVSSEPQGRRGYPPPGNYAKAREKSSCGGSIVEIVENKRASLQGDRGAYWSLRIVSDCEAAGHGGGPYGSRLRVKKRLHRLYYKVTYSSAKTKSSGSNGMAGRKLSEEESTFANLSKGKQAVRLLRDRGRRG
jgi:hypothetical protein